MPLTTVAQGAPFTWASLTDANGIALSSSSPVPTSPPSSSTSSITAVAASATSVTLLSTNTTRKGGSSVYNDSTAIMFLTLGATTSATLYTLQVPPNGFYEVPAAPTIYTGPISALWASATGNARITELT